MTAKQMFKELGYKYKEDVYSIRYYKGGKTMSFMKKMNGGKTVWGVPQILEIKEHQAITQQMKELEWI